jgi:excisionase family DNA binding protein
VSRPPAKPPKPAHLISTAKAAERLGDSPNTVRSLIAQGLIKGYKVGRLIKPDSEAVENFIYCDCDRRLSFDRYERLPRRLGGSGVRRWSGFARVAIARWPVGPCRWGVIRNFGFGGRVRESAPSQGGFTWSSQHSRNERLRRLCRFRRTVFDLVIG